MSRNQIASAAIVLAAFMSSPVQAQTTEMAAASPVATPAENVRNLNIMLMVTSLRCRGGAHDFSAEYERFAQTHGRNIAAAQNQLVARLAAQHGRRGSERRLDRQSVRVANRYGLGHPTLNCSQLKTAATQLSLSQDREKLQSMAAQLLDPTPRSAALALADTAPTASIAYDSSISASEAPAWLRE